MNEPKDPDTWADNYLCSYRDEGLRWSAAGPIAGMRCTWIQEVAEPKAEGWDNNYLCLPTSSPLTLSWSSKDPIDGQVCIQIIEPADPHTWQDNYLCHPR